MIDICCSVLRCRSWLTGTVSSLRSVSACSMIEAFNETGQPTVDISQVMAMMRVTGPRELLHGERESFIGEYSEQRSGLGA